MVKIYTAFWGIVITMMISDATVAQTALPINEVIESANVAVSNDDCSKALKILNPLVISKNFNDLPSQQKIQYYNIAVNCALSINDTAQSYDLSMKATKIPEISGDIWNIRLAIEVDQKRFADALVTLELLSKEYNSIFNAVPIRTLGFFHRWLKESNESNLRFKFLEIITSDAYKPEDPFRFNDYFLMNYASLLIEKGNESLARSFLMKLSDPESIVEASLDPVLKQIFATIDVRAAAERELVKSKILREQHPNWLSGLAKVARLQRMLGRPDEALASLQKISGKIDMPDQFRDYTRLQNWYWDDLGKTYRVLGRYKEALNAYQKGAVKEENGGINVSQLINLAYLQFFFHRYEEVRVTLDSIDLSKRDVSPYGRMVMRFAHGCSLYRLGKKQEAEADIAYVTKHRSDNEEVFTNLSACMGLMDQAAASIISRLDSPDTRLPMLLGLMEYDDLPATSPKDELYKRFTELAKRKDVAAALKRYGGSRRIRLQESEIGN